NYFIGNDPSKWHTDVPTYAKVRYQSIYPGIDLLYYGNQEGRLEHDFVVSPGADPNAIVLSMRGSEGAVSEHSGGLTLHTKTGDLTLRSPVVYQEVNGQRKTIPATYSLASNKQIKFQVGSYDKSEPLVIDPVIEYTGVWGGYGEDIPTAIAIDPSGNAYVVGQTASPNFPLVNALLTQGPVAGGICAVVSELNASGTALIYSTFWSGVSTSNNTSMDAGASANGIAVDNAGRAYVTGWTTGGLPLKNAYQPKYGGNTDAFVTVFGPGGDSLVYSTYLGTLATDEASAIALDADQNAYITGATGAYNGFPQLHSILTEGSVFVAKFNNVGALQYSTVFSAGVGTTSIAVDATGSAYVAGYAGNGQIAITKGAFQSDCAIQICGFVAKIGPVGDTLVYATFLQGPVQPVCAPAYCPYFVAVDSAGGAYVAGTTGQGFPVTKNAFQKTFGGEFDGFVAKLNSSGTGLVWSTYLGGSSDDQITGLALDQYRTVYVSGLTFSSNFPLKAPLYGRTGGISQGFVTTLSGSLGSIVYYSTYLEPIGGNGLTTPAVAVDKALNVYVTAETTDGQTRPTRGALSIHTPGNEGGNQDIYVSKLVIMDDLALGLSASPSPVAQGSNLTYTIAVTSKGPDFGYNVRMSDPIPAGTTFVSYNAGGGKCTAPAVGGTGLFHCELLQLNKGDTWNVKLTVHVNAASGSTLSNTATTVSNTQDFTPANNTGTITTPVD
ncbi:MAG: SBBP repeat-containing protein, partial [Silvibacterium sp.]